MDEDSDSFFDEVEVQMNIKIPQQLKLNLKLQGFSSAIIFADITEKDISEIENFMRTDLKETVEDSEKYCGVFKNNPTKFCCFSW